MTELGQRIRKLRTQKNMTQEELVKGNITRIQLSMIERGTANPSLDTLRFIAERLEVPMACLFDESFCHYRECAAFIDRCNELLQNAKYTEVVKNIETFLSRIGDLQDFAYQDIIGKIYCILGAASFKLKNKCARDYVEKSLEYLEAENFADYYCKSLNLLGEIAYAEGCYDDSETYLQKAYGIINKVPFSNFALKFDTQYNLMLTYRKQGKLQEAIGCGEACVKHAENSEHFNGSFGQLNVDMLLMWGESGKYEKALDYGLRAVDYFKFREDEHSMHDCYIHIAAVYRRMGKFYTSASYVALAVRYFEGNKARSHLTKAKCELIKTRFFIQKDTLALISLIVKIMDSEYLKPSDKTELTAVLNLLQLTEQEMQIAIECLLECEKTLSEYADSEFIIYVYSALSKLYKKQGDIETAYSYLIKVNDFNRRLYKEFDI